jgi:glycosyltransferase involved in cell wall biosynthesis
MLERPDVTIAVSTYNRASLLRLTLESLIEQETDGKLSYEILVVDNGSTDSTRVVVEELSMSSNVDIRYVYEDTPGLCYARNKALHESHGKWIAIFDDDQIADKRWLKELHMVALSAGAHCVGGKRLLALPTSYLSRLGKECRALLGEVQWGEIQRAYFGGLYPCDANVIIKREVFDLVGQYDTDMHYGAQDQDLSWRIAREGLKMWYNPKAIVYHIIPHSFLTDDYFKWNAQRWGVHFAYRDRRRLGITATILACFARIIKALLLNLPRLLFGFLSRSELEVRDTKVLLWRSAAYARACIKIMFPNVFPQNQYFDGLRFRKKQLFDKT